MQRARVIVVFSFLAFSVLAAPTLASGQDPSPPPAVHTDHQPAAQQDAPGMATEMVSRVAVVTGASGTSIVPSVVRSNPILRGGKSPDATVVPRESRSPHVARDEANGARP